MGRDRDVSLGINDAHLLHNESFANVLFPVRQGLTSLLEGFDQRLPISAKLIPDLLPLLPVKVIVRKIVTLLFVVLENELGLDQGVQHGVAPGPDPLLSLIIGNLPVGLLVF